MSSASCVQALPGCFVSTANSYSHSRLKVLPTLCRSCSLHTSPVKFFTFIITSLVLSTILFCAAVYCCISFISTYLKTLSKLYTYNNSGHCIYIAYLGLCDSDVLAVRLQNNAFYLLILTFPISGTLLQSLIRSVVLLETMVQ